MKGQTDEDASEQEEEGKGEEDTNREISLKAHSSYRELQHGLTKEEPYTEWMEWMSHWKWKETKQQPGTAGPGNILGCCLVSLPFLCDIHSVQGG